MQLKNFLRRLFCDIKWPKSRPSPDKMGSISAASDADLPYWQVNVAPEKRTTECPEFLRDISLKDRGIIGTPDSEYRVDTWSEVVEKCKTNKLEQFKRVPSDLRKYLEFIWNLKQNPKYEDVKDFVLKERLHWQLPLVPRGMPFMKREDVKILCNDWPYGIDKRIVHLVVWTKFELEEDLETKDLTDEARAGIDHFVNALFCPHMPPAHVVWFHNSSDLKSIHAVEHFHVMLFDPNADFIRHITNGDVPRWQLALEAEKGPS